MEFKLESRPQCRSDKVPQSALRRTSKKQGRSEYRFCLAPRRRGREQESTQRSPR